MASFLRQLVAGPRKGHPEAGLDLCYVTDHIIATSGPSQTYPQRAYRNPLNQLVAFLDAKHGADWAIWEFRAEGTGYPDHLVYDRIYHYPFPDHHPPPFKLMPLIFASMRNWLHGGALHVQTGQDAGSTASTTTSASVRDEKRVVVVHCKAGKGRSGTTSVSYLVAEEGWTVEDALSRFTERRMRPMFGAGVSIPSQLRWVGYVDRWAKNGRKYHDRPVEVVEIHMWGLRNGVKVDVEGFVDDGRRIHSFHTFKKNERQIVQGGAPKDGGISDLVWEMAGYSSGTKAPEEAELSQAANNEENNKPDVSILKSENVSIKPPAKSKTELITETPKQTAEAAASRTSTFSTSSKTSTASKKNQAEPGGMAVIFRPQTPIRIPNSDVNIAVERRNRAHKSIGLTMVSSVAHVWFNAFFEGHRPEQDGTPGDSGVFTIDWDAMDGIKGTSRKGTRGFDRMSVVWRFADVMGSATGGGGPAAAAAGGKEEGTDEAPGGTAVGEQHGPGADVKAVDWHGVSAAAAATDVLAERDLGLRMRSPASADISRASSVVSTADPKRNQGPADETRDDKEALESVKTSGPSGEELNS